MYYKNNDEVATKQVLLEISNREYVLSLLDVVKDVVRKFDGKVLNKRFKTALQNGIEQVENYAEHTYIRMEQVYHSLNIEISIKDFARTRAIIVCSANTQKDKYNNEENVCLYLDEKFNKRIKADALIRAIDKQAENIKREIAENRKALEKVADWKKEFETMYNRLEELNKEIPSIVEDCFDLRFRMHHQH